MSSLQVFVQIFPEFGALFLVGVVYLEELQLGPFLELDFVILRSMI